MVSLFNKRQRGDAAEDQALKQLRAAGLKLIARNYHCRRGEIDLIMREQQDIAFIEVRQRSRSDFGSAAESVTIHKQRRLLATAKYWLSQHPQYANDPMRFDVIGIDAAGQLNWIRNAFQDEG